MLVVLAVLVVLVVAPPAARAQAMQTVSAVDLPRYMGDWYEIARYPNRFQTQCAGEVRVSYGPRADGRVDVVNRCRRGDGSVDEARGIARVIDGSGGAKLKVRFAPGWLSWIPLVWGDYWIIGLEPSYRWAVVGHPGRGYLWILARTPSMDEAAYAQALEAARAQGYDLARLQRTPGGAP